MTNKQTTDAMAAAHLIADQIFRLTEQLEAMFPGRSFTPDGHLVGSLGEVVAAHRYDLTLNPASTEGHDAVAQDGRKVEIKLTSGKSVALRSKPEHLIVLFRDGSGQIVEVYNGPGAQVWEVSGREGKNGQRPISLSTLRKLNGSVSCALRLQVIELGNSQGNFKA